ncbi:MAG: ATP-binding cassette domain-containing protein, partial [Betaproteobacteria bacterium]
MLEVERIRVSYGAAPAISEVSIRIGPGELACVVGPNGAGKTTLINAIAG